MPALQQNPAPTASAFARIGLLAYTLLIVYASWYPFTGWQNIGLSATAYLWVPLPHYWTIFDLATNVAGYIPFGILMVFALYPRVRRGRAVALTIACGVLLTGSMEAVQTFLPTRVASNLDLLTNAVGVVIGAVAGVLLSRTFLEQSRFLVLRRQWLSPDAGRALIVVALWPLAQLYPQGYLFGHGQITPILSDWLSAWLAMPLDLGATLRHDAELSIGQYWLSETIITTCGLTGAMLTLLCVLRDSAPKVLLMLGLLIAAVALKALASALLFAPENAFAWMTPGAEGGLLLGAIMLTGLVFAPQRAQRLVAALMLMIGLAAVNAAPSNPYFTATLQTWVQGKFLNFNGAAQFLSLLWPFAALWLVAAPARS
jgi:VanZ family protein